MSNNPPTCPRCRTPIPLALIRQGGAVACPTCNTRLVLQDANPTALAWHLSRDDREKAGPFSWVQLQQLAGQGLLLPTDRLWRTGMSGWTRAGAVPGLFPSPAPPAAGRDTDVPTVTGVSSVLSDSAVAVPRPSETSGPPSHRGLHSVPRRTVTLGDFQILKKLGAGAMGAVYLAQQRSLNRLVALKVLSKALAAQPAYVRRFFREAGVMSRLDHPNIVGFHAVGEEKGLHYYAMEFVDGFTLTALQERRGGRLVVADALQITIAVARALAYAHEHGIIHRDVKPANLMINRLGYVKITDLGLAKALDEDVSLTCSGAGVGTPQYMAPEQAHDARRADPRSDIYALGVVLYQMLTGTLPFQGESAVALALAKERGHFISARRLNRDVPDRLDLMIDKMLAADMARRHRGCAELIRDLESLGMAGEHLGFNPLHSVAPPADGEGRVEILLIEDNADDILLAQEALERNPVPTNLSVLGGPAEAPAFLRREGKYAAAPRPDLIILGRNLLQSGGLETVAALKADPALREIPLVVLTTSAEAVELFEANGIDLSLKVSRPADLEQLQDFLAQGTEGSSVVVVQLPPDAGGETRRPGNGEDGPLSVPGERGGGDLTDA